MKMRVLLPVITDGGIRPLLQLAGLLQLPLPVNV